MKKKLMMYNELVDKIEHNTIEKNELLEKINRLESIIQSYKKTNERYDKINVQMLKNFIATERLSDEQREKLEKMLIIS